jgi:GNAT superfamily N-acetyltransferase
MVNIPVRTGAGPQSIAAIWLYGYAGIVSRYVNKAVSDGERSMGDAAEISLCTPEDYFRILDALPEFWDGRDTRALHHPFLINEFKNSAFVIRGGPQVLAYLFGFLSQSEPVGYVHTIAARASARRRRLAQQLFDHFVGFARQHGCTHIKAITTPSNAGSIAFHKSLGMELLGEPNANRIPVVPNYAGRGVARVVFWKAI